MTTRHVLAAVAAAMAAAAGPGCATTPGFETGRALPEGDTRIILGLSVALRRDHDHTQLVVEDLPLDIAALVRVVHGMGNGFDTDLTLSLPMFPLCLGMCTNLGIAAGLKQGDEESDALAGAWKVEAGVDGFFTAENRSYSGLRFHASGRLIGSVHPAEAFAVYAAPYVLWEGFRNREHPEGKRERLVRRSASVVSFGALAGSKMTWPTDEPFATYLEADWTATPWQPGGRRWGHRFTGRLGFDLNAEPSPSEEGADEGDGATTAPPGSP